LFHNKEVFFAPALPLEEVLTQQEQEILLQADLQVFTQSENVSFENMKNAIIYGSNLASSVWRNLELKEWLL
jgi:hypothetical protein